MLNKLRIFVFILAMFLFPKNVYAQLEFYVDAEVSYEVQETGATKVIFDLALENASPDLYAESYTLTLNSIEPRKVTAFYGDQEIDAVVTLDKDSTLINVSFSEVIVGVGSKRSFTITFEEDSFADKSGEVWEISIPRVDGANVFRNYTVYLTVPDSFGAEAFLSPEPEEKEEEYKRKYKFSGREITETGINAAFGEFQVFNFTLKYHLENPVNKRTDISIAIPPDTAFQKLYYQKITPSPANIKIDSDGNWLATYSLKPRERLDMELIGAVQIFSSPRKLSEAPVKPQQYYLSSTEYWQANDPEIKEISENLKTPQRIYEYVSKKLDYDFLRVKPNVKRLGAKGALGSPGSAISLEFTDLFIALSRAAGIPAREINGYAYTENPDIQPLSLVADVLHSWPEYWDDKRSAWIPVDPTWASTTGGVDYFTKLDLRHFTFVIHGENDTKPFAPGTYKLGSNPQKDVFVSFGKLPENRYTEPLVTANIKRAAPFMRSKIMVNIKNPGPSALYDLRPKALFEGKVSQEDFIGVLPPFSTYTIEVIVPYSLIGNKTPNEVKIVAGGKEVVVPTFKRKIIFSNLIAITLILITLTLSVLNRSGKSPKVFLIFKNAKVKIINYGKSLKNKKIHINQK